MEHPASNHAVPIAASSLEIRKLDTYGIDRYINIYYCTTQVYGDEAEFSNDGDKFTALMFSFPLHKVKGGPTQRERESWEREREPGRSETGTKDTER